MGRIGLDRFYVAAPSPVARSLGPQELLLLERRAARGGLDTTGVGEYVRIYVRHRT